MAKDKKKKLTKSRGQQKYLLAADIQKSQKDYEAQVAKEAEKAKDRSMWSTLGGILGAAVGVAAAPYAIAATGVGAIGSGLITAASTGLGSKGFSVAGVEVAKARKKGRKDIKVDKFFDKQAMEATESFKDYDKKIAESATNQALLSGAFAGLQASGALKSASEKIKKGLNINQSPINQSATSSVESFDYISGKEAMSSSQPFAIATDHNVHKKIFNEAASKGANYIEAFPTSNRSLYTAIGDVLQKNAIQSGIGYASSKLLNPSVQISSSTEDIQLPQYNSIV